MADRPTNVGDADSVEPSEPADVLSTVQMPAEEMINATVLVIPFSFAGMLTPGLLSMKFPLVGEWTFRAVSVICVHMPTGSEIVLDVLYNASSIYGAGTDRPRVFAGSRQGSHMRPPVVTDYGGTPGSPGVFACSIARVGSESPGGDLTLALYLTSV